MPTRFSSSNSSWRHDLTTWQVREADTNEWLPAVVPGCVHTDLAAAGAIEDPFYRDNESRLQWIEDRDWIYRTDIEISEAQRASRRIELVFNGLDTFAEVDVNGTRVLFADNMYRVWRVDVTDHIHQGVNRVQIRFLSAMREGLTRAKAHPFSLPAINDRGGSGRRVSPFVRKAPYHFGWDWGPRFVTCGLWRPAALEGRDGARIDHVQVVQEELTDRLARLRVNVALDRLEAGPLSVSVSIPHAGGISDGAVLVDAIAAAAEIRLGIPNPERWWPNGMGRQTLYPIEIRLEDERGALDHRTLQIGLRTLRLDRSRDAGGSAFRFVVNDVPLFAKGANWIPADSFPARVDEPRYRRLLGSAAQAGMNMLRVWGGGIYEEETFYDLCDELGLLVWQDFHFSCSMYPADADFLASVEAEAIGELRRLRNRACMALWCGNNEMAWGWQAWGWKWRYTRRMWHDYERLFHDLLPRLCAEHDPSRTYWPSSPWSDPEGGSPNDVDHGDMHYWGVWHKKEPFETYLKQHPRFMSEYGFQSFPLLRTVEAYAEPEDYDIESPVMRAHQKHPEGNHLIWTYMARHYPVPRDFSSFLYVSQILQAEGIRIATEHLRRIGDRCGGALYWQLNDCWPVASWSSIDYFGRWKALHYAARRFFAEVMVSISEEKDRLNLFVVSDRAEPFDGRLDIRLMDFFGGVYREHAVRCRIPARSAEAVAEFPVSSLVDKATAPLRYLTAQLSDGNGVYATARHFFGPHKALQLPVPKFAVSGKVSGRTAEIEISSTAAARHVWLEHAEIDGHFEDNFFDLDAGEQRTVTFEAADGVLPAEFFQGIRVRSIVDAF